MLLGLTEEGYREIRHKLDIAIWEVIVEPTEGKVMMKSELVIDRAPVADSVKMNTQWFNYIKEVVHRVPGLSRWSDFVDHALLINPMKQVSQITYHCSTMSGYVAVLFGLDALVSHCLRDLKTSGDPRLQPEPIFIDDPAPGAKGKKKQLAKAQVAPSRVVTIRFLIANGGDIKTSAVHSCTKSIELSPSDIVKFATKSYPFQFKDIEPIASELFKAYSYIVFRYSMADSPEPQVLPLSGVQDLIGVLAPINVSRFDEVLIRGHDIFPIAGQNDLNAYLNAVSSTFLPTVIVRFKGMQGSYPASCMAPSFPLNATWEHPQGIEPDGKPVATQISINFSEMHITPPKSKDEPLRSMVASPRKRRRLQESDIEDPEPMAKRPRDEASVTDVDPEATAKEFRDEVSVTDSIMTDEPMPSKVDLANSALREKELEVAGMDWRDADGNRIKVTPKVEAPKKTVSPIAIKKDQFHVVKTPFVPDIKPAQTMAPSTSQKAPTSMSGNSTAPASDSAVPIAIQPVVEAPIKAPIQPKTVNEGAIEPKETAEVVVEPKKTVVEPKKTRTRKAVKAADEKATTPAAGAKE